MPYFTWESKKPLDDLNWLCIAVLRIWHLNNGVHLVNFERLYHMQCKKIAVCHTVQCMGLGLKMRKPFCLAREKRRKLFGGPSFGNFTRYLDW